jgi:hypothetical protein
VKSTSRAFILAICSLTAVPLSFGQCRVCQEWQGTWICVTSNTRVKCLVDGDTCTMNLTSGCGISASGGDCKSTLPKGLFRAASSKSHPDARLFFIVGSAGDPLALREVAFQTGTTNWGVKDGKLNNNTHSAVVGYQLAFAVVDRGTWKVNIVLGPVIDSTISIKPKEQRGLIPIPMKDYLGQSDFSAVGVFVRQARFSDGSVWEADLARIKADVEGAASDVQGTDKSTS